MQQDKQNVHDWCQFSETLSMSVVAPLGPPSLSHMRALKQIAGYSQEHAVSVNPGQF